MDPFDRALRVIGYAIAGPFVGALLGIVAFILLGVLVTVPAVDWRHSEALADLAAGTLSIGLIFGTLLGVPIGALLGLVIGVILGFRTPAAHRATAPSPDLAPPGKAGKPGGPFDDESATAQGFAAETPARPTKRWKVLARSGLLLTALWIALNLLWIYQRRFEHEETAHRLRQIASGDASVREQALDGIRRLGPYAAPPVAEALRSQDPSTRRAAILASGEVLAICQGELGAMNCVTGFVPGLGAARSGFEQLEAALFPILGGEDRTLRLDAVRALLGLGDDRRRVIDSMSQYSRAVLREELKREGNPVTRRELIRLLGRTRPTMSLEGSSALADAMGARTRACGRLHSRH